MAAVAAFGIALAQGASTVQNEHPSDGVRADPYLWLEDVHGAKPLAWVEEQNARARAVLQADPQYQKDYDAILRVLDATDRIPYGTLEHEYVFNFWQDAEHPKGLWRRTQCADYATSEPHWELLLDLDKLAADERENWVWEGADCSPALKRCLLSLSRGGGDATVVREFDLDEPQLCATDGFALAEAKSNITYLDEDTVLFGTDFGADSMTASGYPRIVKLWKRGQPMAAARTLFEATGRRRRGAGGGVSWPPGQRRGHRAHGDVLYLRVSPAAAGWLAARAAGAPGRRSQGGAGPALCCSPCARTGRPMAQRRSPRDPSSPTSSGPMARLRRASGLERTHHA